MHKPFRLVFPAFLIFAFQWLSAQTASHSPYSYSGIGDMNYNGFIQHVMTGRTARAFHADNSFTCLNPASYGFLKLTSMQFGARGDAGTFNTANSQSQFSNATFSYFAMGFGLSDKGKLGMSFGLLPHSSVGYNLFGSELFDSSDVSNNYSGKGGVDRVYWGIGYRLTNNLSVGGNFNFMFGNISESQARVYLYNGQTFSYASEKDFHVSGITGDLGVQYTGRTKKGIEHCVGLTLHAGNKINGNTNRIVRTFNSQGGFYVDTIDFARNEKGYVHLPAGIGAAYSTGKDNRWWLSAEYSAFNWSNFSSFGQNYAFQNSNTLSVGGWYQPSAVFEKALKGEKFKKYLRFVRYSAGFYQQQSQLVIKNTRINEIGTSFGIQLPVVRQIKLPGGEQLTLVSRINIATELAKRGTTTNGLLQENYIRVYLGFNFSDKWFVKRKYL